jgi:spermidine/putrescine transport system substrate-binding protein
MPNFRNVDPRWVDVAWDKGRNYSVPNLWGTMGLAVDTAAYGGTVDSLKLLFEPPPELQGRIGVVKLSNDVINAGLRYLGKPRCNKNSKDLAALAQLLMNAKHHWRWIEYYLSEAMATGNLSLVYYWSNPVPFVRQTIPTLKYVYPREGVGGWMDNVVVLKDAPNVENAKLFQNFMMGPEAAALNSEYGGAANAIPASAGFLPAGFADMPEIKPPPGVEPEFVPLCPKDVRRKYEALWAEVIK